MKVAIECAYCLTVFHHWPSQGRRFCSKICADKYSKNHPNPGTYIKHHKGLKGTSNGNWSPDKTYSGLHQWISRVLGKPSYCENCGSNSAKKFEWANKSRNYLLDKNDWIRLCTSCHRKYDNHSAKAWNTRRQYANR